MNGELEMSISQIESEIEKLQKKRTELKAELKGKREKELSCLDFSKYSNKCYRRVKNYDGTDMNIGDRFYYFKIGEIYINHETSLHKSDMEPCNIWVDAVLINNRWKGTGDYTRFRIESNTIHWCKSDFIKDFLYDPEARCKEITEAEFNTVFNNALNDFKSHTEK